MKKAFLIPKEGVKVRDERGSGFIPPEGGARMLNSYYNRRIADGDLIVRDVNSPSAPPATVESGKESGKSGKTTGQKDKK